MRNFMAVTKALADANRVRLLLALRKKELCLCQLIELLRLAPSTVSKHMSVLKDAHLVKYRKEGRWMYYRLPDEDAPIFVRRAIDWVSSSVGDDRLIAEDRERLKAIAAIDPAKLCERQMGAGADCGRHEQVKSTRSRSR